MTEAVPIVLLVALIAVLGDGFMGGGGDDGRYLQIAEQWLAHGPRVPTTHWEGRWPVTVPLALSVELFGLHRWSVALPSWMAAAVSVLLIKRLGDKHFGNPVGILAAAVFAVVPAFTRQATSSTIEPVELVLILGAFNLLHRPMLAGVMLGLAFQARETAIAALPILLYLSGDWRQAARILGGFLAPFAIELVTYYGLTGDALFRRHLSLAHTTLATPVLPTTEARPLLNLDIIRNWHRESGIHVHWTVDGYLNLIANPTTALLPLLTLIQLLRVGTDRKVNFLLLTALFYSAVLIYGLAVFPTPRMFLPAFAALAIAFAALAVRQWDTVAIAFTGTIAIVSMVCTAAHPGSARWQSIAEDWAAKRPGQVETTQQDYFVFSRELQKLPRTGMPYLLLLQNARCGVANNFPVVEQASGGPIAQMIGYRSHLCLYRVR